MSTLDQAFIKAYSKGSRPAPAPTESARGTRQLKKSVKTAPSRAVSLEASDDPYQDGTWYRLDEPDSANPEADAAALSAVTPPQRPGRNARRPHIRFREEPQQLPSTPRETSGQARSPRQLPEPAADEPNETLLERESAIISHEELAASFTVTIAGGWESLDAFEAAVDMPDTEVFAPLEAVPEPNVAVAPSRKAVRVDPPAASVIAKPHFPVPAVVADGPAAEEELTDQQTESDGKPNVQASHAVAPATVDTEATHAIPAAQVQVEAEPKAAVAVAPIPIEAKAEPAAPARPEFQAAWEVERFSWPAACDELLASALDDWGLAVKQLLASAKRGCKTLAVAGVRRGEGRSTLALCLARLAAQTGAQIALIDADFENPQLATMLGVGTECDWKLALADGQPLTEASIVCLADALTFIPLQQSVPIKQVSFKQPAVVGMLKTAAAAFDLVIVDVGPIAAPEHSAVWGGKTCPFDGVLLVRDLRRTDAEETTATAASLRKQGLGQVIVLENFAGTQSAAAH